jgi:DUF1680 family protein
MSGGNDRDYARKPWFRCACCPPNVMRTLASLEHYVVLGGQDGLRLHQFVSGSWTAPVGASQATVSVETDYPWDGLVVVRVDAAPGPFRLSLRVPAWADGATFDGRRAAPGYVQVEAAAGDVVELRLPMEVRTTTAHPRVDAVRGCVALERGPLVYAAEQADHDTPVDDLHIDLAAPRAAEHKPELLGGVTVVTVGDLTLVPYYAWANRGTGPMRVWLPTL